MNNYEEYNILKYFDLDIYDPFYEYKPIEYVYMIEFIDHPGCYKVGSSKDPLARLNAFSSEYGSARIILLGMTENKILSERRIQHCLNSCSNRYNVWCANRKETNYVGSEKSQEHFNLNIFGLAVAIDAFKKNCTSVTFCKYLEKRIIETGVPA